MIYVMEFIKGITIALGIIIGMVAGVAVFVVHLKNSSGYQAEDLLEPFQLYLKKLVDEEWYEQKPMVEGIIDVLKTGKVPDEVDQFCIKKDVAIHTESQGSGTTFKLEKIYIVEYLKQK